MSVSALTRRSRQQAVQADVMGELAAAQVASGARLLTCFGTDERAEHGSFGLYLVFLEADGHTVIFRAALDAVSPAYPSLTPYLPAVHWDEREMQDLLGFHAEGHPNPNRLVLREDWPVGVYPLRKDFDQAQVPEPSRALEHFQPTPVEGDGVVSVPVGPIHAGIIEPGHFRFAAVGEIILKLDAQLFYTHRGIEKLAEGRTIDGALQVAERTCGACAYSHALAYSQAIESLSDVEIPRRARWLRTIVLELERLYNHVGDVGNICAGVGFSIGAMEGAQLKEELQQLNERLVGHRFLRGVAAPGGLRRDVDAATLREAIPVLQLIRARVADFAAMLVATESLMDRARGTGVLPLDAVNALGGVGVAARASGATGDMRRDFSSDLYADLGVTVDVPVQQSGDAEARMRQRIAEAEVSFGLLDALLNAPVDGPIRRPLVGLAAGMVGLSAVESPRGANVHAVILGADHRVQRLRIRSASFCNWPLVPLTVPGNLVPDFPLINKSFELCYACLDR